MKTKIFTLFLALVVCVGSIVSSNTQVDGIWYNFDDNNRTASVTYPKGYHDDYSGSIIIPASVEYKSVIYDVTSIEPKAFYNCTSLTSVTIPSSITSIGASTFFSCTSLASVTIPNSVTSIDEYAFNSCTSLASITIPNSVTSIGRCTFANCTGLISVEIPNSVISIGNQAFYGCTGLTSITIPHSVTSIGNQAFEQCTSLTSATIGNSVTSLLGTFFNCTSLTSVTIPNSVTSISGTFFGCTSLTSVTIPNSVTSIGSGTFSGCTSLTSVTIPNSVTSIEDGAFKGCTGLTFIEIPNSVTSIGYAAFSDCTGLTSVTIPNSVTSIGISAFNGCTGLTSITIPHSVTSIGNQAFFGCNVSEIHFIGNIDNWCKKSWSWVDAVGQYYSLYIDDIKIEDLVIPNSVTSIGDDVFAQCAGLKSVTIPNSVTSIGRQAFAGCTGITSIEIPHNVTSIGDNAFYGCTGLTSMTIGSGATSIGVQAFAYCTGLTSVTCTAITPPELQWISMNWTIYYYVFQGVTLSQVALYVPKESIEAYKVADQWKNFGSILPISAQETETTTVKTTTTENSADVTWPFVAGADIYELVIKDQEGKVVCTLIFNAQGQLTSIAFNAPSRDGAPQKTQTAGFSFTVTGLEPGTEYDLTITAKNESGQELDKKNVTFHTNWPNGIEELHIDSDKPVKLLMDGQVYIHRGEHVYDAEGKMVR